MLRIRSSAAILMLCLLAAACPAAGTPEDMLMEAQRLENAGSVQQAADKYESFLKQYTDHSQVVDAHYRLGKCYDALGMVDQAVGHLKAVTSSDKKNFRGRQDAFYALGKLQASTKNYDGAIATYEAMLGEGAGIYEDEVLGLCGGYYAIAGGLQTGPAVAQGRQNGLGGRCHQRPCPAVSSQRADTRTDAEGRRCLPDAEETG